MRVTTLLSLTAAARHTRCRTGLRAYCMSAPPGAAPHTELAEGRCSPEPASLASIREETEELMPSGAHMLSGAQQGRLLWMLARFCRAQRVLELGCFTGYATTWMALGLPPDGRVVTCERDERAAEVARRHFAAAPAVAQRVDLVLGDAMDAVRALPAPGEPGWAGPFDLVFLDADKKRYAAYYRLLLEREQLAPHGLLLADNVLWKNTVLELLPPSPRAAAPMPAPTPSAGSVPNPWTDVPAPGESTAKLAGRARRSAAIRDALHAFSLELRSDGRVNQLLLPLRDGLTWAQRAPPGADRRGGGRRDGDNGAATDAVAPAPAGDAAGVAAAPMAQYLAAVGSGDRAAVGAGVGAGAALRGRLLQMLVRLCGSGGGGSGGGQRVLELSGRAGHETLWLAGGLRDGGTIVSFEADAQLAAAARARLDAAGVLDRVDARARAPPRAWEADAAFDLVVCGDAPAELPAAWVEAHARALAPHGMLVLGQSPDAAADGALHDALQAARLPGSARLRTVTLPSPDGDGGLLTLAMVGDADV